MIQTDTDALQQAIDQTDAVLVAFNRYAYRIGSMPNYRICSGHVLANSEKWRVRYPGVDMPSWWTPERRFAWRYAAQSPANERDSAMHAESTPRFICSAHWFTADLETGEEVSA